jgi:hypothetical protein
MPSVTSAFPMTNDYVVSAIGSISLMPLLPRNTVTTLPKSERVLSMSSAEPFFCVVMHHERKWTNRALKEALDLLRGTITDAAFPPNPKAAVR